MADFSSSSPYLECALALGENALQKLLELMYHIACTPHRPRRTKSHTPPKEPPSKRRKMSENEREFQKPHSPNHPPIHAALRGTPTPICPKAGPQPKMRPWPHISDTNRTKNLFLATPTAAPSYELAAPQPHRPAMEPRHPTAALPRLRYGRVTLGRRTTRHQGWQAPLWWVLGGTSRTGLVSKKPVGFRLNPQ